MAVPVIGDLVQQRHQICIAASLTHHLEVASTLFNAELRQNSGRASGVMESSARISDGHVYGNIRDVNNIYLMRRLARIACGVQVAEISATPKIVNLRPRCDVWTAV